MANYTLADQKFMARAMRLARKGKYSAHPNPHVGAVLVLDNQIIGEGWHHQAGLPNAEINALESITQS
ncbi:MAG: riboflavin biosynthesis protein RibD, partial [Woeseiaceae bacterium]|nr:riboflavin biosynthesis protein RibD [Woeseiaceae bacterium]